MPSSWCLNKSVRPIQCRLGSNPRWIQKGRPNGFQRITLSKETLTNHTIPEITMVRVHARRKKDRPQCSLGLIKTTIRMMQMAMMSPTHFKNRKSDRSFSLKASKWKLETGKSLLLKRGLILMGTGQNYSPKILNSQRYRSQKRLCPAEVKRSSSCPWTTF